MTESHVLSSIGYAPQETQQTEGTRAPRLKWVIVVDENLPGGRAVNAAVCVASATAAAMPGLLGPDVTDATGRAHPGLPWTGCSILAASAEQLAQIRARAIAAEDMFHADMPTVAQHSKLYDDYIEQMANAESDGVGYYALSVIGPRNRVARMVHKLSLLP